MSPRRNHSITDELVKALQNDKVRAILGGIFDERLKSLAETVDFLLKENDRKTVEIKSLTEELVPSLRLRNKRLTAWKPITAGTI